MRIGFSSVRAMVAAAVLVVFVGQVAAQYSPSPVLKKAYDKMLKEADTAISATKTAAASAKAKLADISKEYEALVIRWDKVKANATKTQADNVKEARTVAAVSLFSLPGQISVAEKNIETNDLSRAASVGNEKTAKSDNEYMDVLIGVGALKKSCESNRKVTSQVQALIPDLEANVKIFKDITIAVENNEEDEGELTSSPSESIAMLKGDAETIAGVLVAIGDAMSGEPDLLQTAYDEIMYLYYMRLYMDPEFEDGLAVEQCLDNISTVLLIVQSEAYTLSLVDDMWASQFEMIAMIEDPFEAMEAYFWLSINADAEYYEAVWALVDFANEQHALALLILE